MRAAVAVLLAALLAARVVAADAAKLRFAFGDAPAAGAIVVRPDATFSSTSNFGFEPGAAVTAKADGVASAQPFYFSARLPAAGNYRVTLTFPGGTDATVKAELRRLVIEHVQVPAGRSATRSFIINTRTPKIAAVGEIKEGIVKLKAPRESVQEAWAWDDALTLEFDGAHPAVSAIEIEPADVPTIFLIGDSTVCDQMKEPYSSWGQMFPRWFKPVVAVANHAESGESYRDSIGRRRLDKMISVMKPGDWMIMQFGHNDQKQIAAGTGSPVTYKAEIRKHVDAVRAHSGTPIIVSPMERRNFDEHAKLKPSLADYAKASREAAQELGVAFIDLNAMSIPFYEALEAHGHDYSRRAFAGQDNTHHDNYGSYELSKFIVQSIRDQKLSLAKFIVDDFGAIDPAHPDDVETFALPASPNFTNQRPLGDEPAVAPHQMKLLRLALAGALITAFARAAEPATAYLFTYFTKNGEDGLHLAWSADGYKWAKLNDGKSYLAPTVGRSKLMRDPCVARGPDGTFHMVWTSGWNENDIGYASTKDFLTWSPEKEIPVMAQEPTVRNSWAPDIHYNEKRGEFLIFWASTIPEKFKETAGASESDYNHRMYSTTTKDFAAFSPTKLFYDPGFSVIDATFLHAGGKHWLIVKDETRNPPKKFLQLAEAESLQGPFGKLSAPFTPAGLWSEGPTAIKIGGDYLVYFDAYIKKHYAAMRSRDLKTWEDVTDKMSFPDEGTPVRMRHGTVIAVPAEIVARLRATSATP